MRSSARSRRRAASRRQLRQRRRDAGRREHGQDGARHLRRLDILVNNAGILRDRMVFNMSEEEWDAVIAVHLKGHFTTTKAASIIFRQQRSRPHHQHLFGVRPRQYGPGQLPRRQGGDRRPDPHGGPRPRPLRRHLQRDPAARRQPHDDVRRDAGRSGEVARRRCTRSVPDGGAVSSWRSCMPEHVAPMVAYLATDEAAYINGRNFLVGGAGDQPVQRAGADAHVSTTRTGSGRWTS